MKTEITREEYEHLMKRLDEVDTQAHRIYELTVRNIKILGLQALTLMLILIAELRR